MSNLVVLPMAIPLIAGIILVFFRNQIIFQRAVSLLVMLANVGVSIYLLYTIQTDGIQRIDFGGWEPPFGILFVADSFSAILVLTTSIVASICLIYAFSSIGESLERMYFYPFVNLLIAGVVGSFLTGDLFNLYVNFEIMLLASYVLVALGGKRIQLRESLKYVLINVLSSWFLVIAIAYMYGSIGTLNLAHISERVAESGQTPLLTVVGLLFLTVFALKAGLFLYYWLPRSYSVAPTAVAALFGGLLTKVGIYAIFRMFTLVFYHEPHITHSVIGVMAALTLILGSIGAVAYKDIRLIITYNVVITVGFILVGLAVATQIGFEGSIYYLVHDMIVKALLFLIVGTMIILTGTSQMDRMSGLIRNYPALGWLFFVVLLSLAGIPPLSGFIGKVLIGQGAVESGAFILLALGFISSLFVLYSLLRVFLNCFWGETIISQDEKTPMKKGWMVPIAMLTFLTIGLGVGAESIQVIVSDAAHTLMNPQVYIDAILYND